MANATPSRLGQINGAGDALAIFLKVFGGEVLTTFNREALYRALTTLRTIANGKSAQFPVSGIIQAYTHTPGEEILGERVNANEVVIPIEGMELAAAFIASIDDAMNHYDYRQIYSTDIGQALSKLHDKNISRTVSMAARATVPNVNGVFAGDTLTSTKVLAGYGTDGPTLYNGIIDGNVLLDQRDVPRSDRSFVTTPTGYALILRSEKPFDLRLNDGKQGLGGYAEGVVKFVDGVPIYKTNNYAATDDRTDATLPASRKHDFSTSVAQLFHKSAAGTVGLQDVTMETEYDMRRQGWLMAGKYICGHGPLRTEAAVEYQTAAPAG